eukprot:51262_1
MTPIIKEHKILYDKIDSSNTKTVLHRLIEDLKIDKLSDEYQALVDVTDLCNALKQNDKILVSPNVSNVHYILKCKYILLDKEPAKKQITNTAVTSNNVPVYDFNSKHEIHFIIPFKAYLSPSFSIYAQLKENGNFILIKTFNSNKPKNNTYTDYFLHLLKAYKYEINDPIRFFAKIGFNITD